MSNALVPYNFIQHFWVAEHIVNPYGALPPSLGMIQPMVLCNWVICADNFTMSVQASAYHYSEPREYLPDGSYSRWEIMCMGDNDPLLVDYDDGSIFAYVPTEIVNRVIQSHGGLAENSSVIIPARFKSKGL